MKMQIVSAHIVFRSTLPKWGEQRTTLNAMLRDMKFQSAPTRGGDYSMQYTHASL